MTQEPFRQVWGGVVALIFAPLAVVASASIGGAAGGHPWLGVWIGLAFAGFTLVLLGAIWIGLKIFLTVRVREVQRLVPDATVFATMRTLVVASTLSEVGVESRAPSYYVIALTRDGVEVWWGGMRRASFRWSEVTELGTGDARFSFSGRSGSSPALLMTVVPSGLPAMPLAFPVIDHRAPVVWLARYANRVLDAARELRGQSPG